MAERYTVFEAISLLSSGVAKALIALAGGAADGEEEYTEFIVCTFIKNLL
jgi:hypothetical protein